MGRFGTDLINGHYYKFDTICDATQVRQDAVDELCNLHYSKEEKKLNFILVVGGFDSSNTAHLLEIPQMRGVWIYDINEADCVHADNTIKHRTMEGDIIEIRQVTIYNRLDYTLIVKKIYYETQKLKIMR